MLRASPQSPTFLAAIPIRNRLVRARSLSATQTRLTAPLKSGILKRLFSSKATEKSFDLDELGLAVWNACDGHSNVEKIITDFAQAHRLNVREAQVAVCTFLRTLLRRNLVALTVAAPKNNKTRKKKGRI